VSFFHQEIAHRLLPDVEPLPSCPSCHGQSIASNGHRTFVDGAQRSRYIRRTCGADFNRLICAALAHRRIPDAHFQRGRGRCRSCGCILSLRRAMRERCGLLEVWA
jgi:hypothetical protein